MTGCFQLRVSGGTHKRMNGCLVMTMKRSDWKLQVEIRINREIYDQGVIKCVCETVIYDSKMYTDKA